MSVLEQLKSMKGTTRTNSDICCSLIVAVIVTVGSNLIIIQRIRNGLSRRSGNNKQENDARQLCESNTMRQRSETKSAY